VDQISDTSPTDAPAQAPDAAKPTDGASTPEQLGATVSAGARAGAAATELDAAAPAGADAATANAAIPELAPSAPDSPAPEQPDPQSPGFRSRGRARRRARFLRKARELAYRDLGGLVFNLHRFGQRNDALVLAKLTTTAHIDSELRAIEAWLQERRAVTVLREAGVTACPRCAAIHSSEDRFCPNCGLSMARHVDLPAGFQPAPAAPAPYAAPPGVPAPETPSPAGVAAPRAQPPPPAPVAAEAGSVASDAQPRAPAAVQPAVPVAAPDAPRARPSSGRSPFPPGAAPATDAQRDTPIPAGEPAEDGPTEILRPPAPGA